MSDKGSDDTSANQTPAQRKADERKQRLAAQLRENLKKRKDLSRHRKSVGDATD